MKQLLTTVETLESTTEEIPALIGTLLAAEPAAAAEDGAGDFNVTGGITDRNQYHIVRKLPAWRKSMRAA